MTALETDAAANAATSSGLRVLARARYPEPGELGGPPPVPGFVLSSFNPLVVEVARRCLRQLFGAAPVTDPDRASRISVLLGSVSGDRTTARVLAEAARRGERVPPLLFFQSNPNAVLGHVAAHWGLAGPVIALSPLCGDGTAALEEAMAAAATLIGDADADAALVIAAEQGEDTGAMRTAVADRPSGDRAIALFVAGDR